MKKAKKKSVLVVSASPRQGGNSDILCDEFARGAREAGHAVEKIRLAERNVGYCLGCYACRRLGRCFKKDDANEIVEKMMSADVVVLATPVYFYSMDAQLKALIDRSVSRWGDFGRFKGTEFWFIVTAADANREMMSATLEGLRGFTRDCMEGSVERGVVYGVGAYEKGEVRALPAMEEAYEAGRRA
ncbi:MAG: flavodoxin family protein [Kiritimatiellae bacterium]|nr:flavodoxin family protein [Kiritimatiellia bacterium]